MEGKKETAEEVMTGNKTMPRLTLHKGEKLRHRSQVEGLFREGKSIYEFPLRIAWRLIDRKKLESSFRTGVPPRVDNLQMLITVPKKKLRKAVERVKMRRRIREAYRLNRMPLKIALDEAEGDRYLQLGIIYIHNECLDYGDVEKKMRKIIGKLGEKIRET